MKVLQVNTVVNSGSTGRIAEEIGNVMMENGHESAIAFGRGDQPSQSNKIRIGSRWNVYSHLLQTRLFDNHGFSSKKATQQLLEEIDTYQPDAVGLHNLHGYYLHVGILFEYLKSKTIPVIWTFHDCWPFTGHCSHFMRVNCEKWKTHCKQCPLSNAYPQSWFRDRSYQNFEGKREAFTEHPNLTIVTPSLWLKKLVSQSFLKEYPVEVIHNGIDLQTFRPIEKRSDKKIVLGVASTWTERKGLNDFVELHKRLDDEVGIVLIGLSRSQIKALPDGIRGIERTENVEELAEWYGKASVFVNPTYVDNFPTTNLEALACGTLVVTYDTGGSPEAVNEQTGQVVPKGDQEKLAEVVNGYLRNDNNRYSKACRAQAEKLFNKEDRFRDYLEIYERVAGNGSQSFTEGSTESHGV